MKNYADTLCEGQRKCLTGTLKFLSISNDLISFVNNDSPVVHLADSRLSTLEVTMSFFSDRETEVLSNTGLDHATKTLRHVPRNNVRVCEKCLRSVLHLAAQLSGADICDLIVACMNVTFILIMPVFKDQSFHLLYVQGIVAHDLSCSM